MWVLLLGGDLVIPPSITQTSLPRGKRRGHAVVLSRPAKRNARDLGAISTFLPSARDALLHLLSFSPRHFGTTGLRGGKRVMRTGAYGGARPPFLLVLPSLSLVRCFGTITLLVLLRLTASIRGLCVFSVAFISFSFLRSHLFCHVLHIHTSITHVRTYARISYTAASAREKKHKRNSADGPIPVPRRYRERA